MNDIFKSVSKNIHTTPYSIEFKDETPWAEWKEVFDKLNRAHGIFQLYIGDCCNFCELVFGEKYEAMLENTEYENSTLRTFARVSRRFPPSFRKQLSDMCRRRPLNFAQLRALCTLNDAEVVYLLRRADEGEWSMKRLWAEVDQLHPRKFIDKFRKWFMPKREQIESIPHFARPITGEPAYVLTGFKELPKLLEGSDGTQ